ncbi:MAG: hypothetical protein HY908_25190 [Myxococcales bacterium]|nr:hypothetical protein [Myxococcales bacterium]
MTRRRRRLGRMLAAWLLGVVGCVGPRGEPPVARPGSVSAPECPRLRALRAEQLELERALFGVEVDLAASPPEPPGSQRVRGGPRERAAEHRLALTVALGALEAELGAGCDAPAGADAAPPEGASGAAAERVRRAARALATLRAGLGPRGELRDLRARLQRQLEDARQARDVVQALCVGDKLAALEGTVALARAHLEERDQAETSGDAAKAEQEARVLDALRQRAGLLAAEARQCVGEDMRYREHDPWRPRRPDPKPEEPQAPPPDTPAATAEPPAEPTGAPPPPARASVVSDTGAPPDLAPAIERELGALAACLPASLPAARFVVGARVDREGALRDVGVRPDDPADIGPTSLACLASALARVRVDGYTGDSHPVSFPLWLAAP